MPAIEHAFVEPPPVQLYLDTNVCIAYLIAGHPHHTQARALVQSLAASTATTLYLSSLSWLEFAHVVTRQDFRDALPASWQRRHHLARWEGPPAVRRAYVEAIRDELRALLDGFAWVELPLTTAVRTLAIEYFHRFGINVQDAAHLASAALAGVTQVASFDVQFRRDDGLHLWNDAVRTSS
jgi:predicted nucleic acid-binding protein